MNQNKTALPSAIIVGDLHIQAGSPPEVARDFARLLGENPADLLVINGDLFDLDHVTREPGHGINRAPARVDRILDAFPDLVRALADWQGRIVWLPGNHDAEICLAPVQDLIRGRLKLGPERLSFEEHTYFQDGLWVEHGHQRDPGNRFHPDTASAVAKQRLSAFPLGCLMTRFLLCRIPQFTNRGDNYMTPLRVLMRVIINHGLSTPRMVALYILSSYKIAWQAFLARRRGDVPESADTPMRSPWRVFHRMYMDRVMICIALVILMVLWATGVLPPGVVLALGLPALGYLLWRPSRKAKYQDRDRKGCAIAAAELLHGQARVVVMGHCHRQEESRLDGGRYLNQGAFHLPTERGRPYVVVETQTARLDYIRPSG